MDEKNCKNRNNESTDAASLNVLIWKMISLFTAYIGVAIWVAVMTLLFIFLSNRNVIVLPDLETTSFFNNRLWIYIILFFIQTVIVLGLVFFSAINNKTDRQNAFIYTMVLVVGMFIVLFWMFMELFFSQLLSIAGAIVFVVSVLLIAPIVLTRRYYNKIGGVKSHIQSTSLSASYTAFGVTIAVFILDKI